MLFLRRWWCLRVILWPAHRTESRFIQSNQIDYGILSGPWLSHAPGAPSLSPFLHSKSKPHTLLIDSCWNGDRRLRDKYGDEVFEAFKEQTSVLPFQAILEVSSGICAMSLDNVTLTNRSIDPFHCLLQGRQELPSDYWKEFARLPYLIIGVGTLGAYLLHPFMQAGSWVVRG